MLTWKLNNQPPNQHGLNILGSGPGANVVPSEPSNIYNVTFYFLLDDMIHEMEEIADKDDIVELLELDISDRILSRDQRYLRAVEDD